MLGTRYNLMWLDTTGRLSAISDKGDNFRDFWIVYKYTNPFWKEVYSKDKNLLDLGKGTM